MDSSAQVTGKGQLHQMDESREDLDSRKRSYHIERLKRELEQCWQDDRDANTRVLQVAGAVVAVLAIVYTFLPNVKDYAGSRELVMFICMVLTAAAEIACVSYAMSTSVISMLRYTYMREIEHELCSYDEFRQSGSDGNLIIGWLETKGVLATMHPGHIYHLYAALHFVGSLAAIVGVTVVCACFLLLFGTIAETGRPFILLAVIAIVPSIIFAVYAIYKVMYRPEEILEISLNIARRSRLVKEGSNQDTLEVLNILRDRKQAGQTLGGSSDTFCFHGFRMNRRASSGYCREWHCRMCERVHFATAEYLS